MNDLTAAHRTLPLGSWVKVTDLKTDRAVVVRINDRGPVARNRIIDLSYGAAKILGMRGVDRVRLDVLQTPEVAENFGLQ
jgi:rare lipoprotein A